MKEDEFVVFFKRKAYDAQEAYIGNDSKKPAFSCFVFVEDCQRMPLFFFVGNLNKGVSFPVGVLFPQFIRRVIRPPAVNHKAVAVLALF